ncbi:MAG: glycosyltransferase family 2 protein [Bacteroidales bacterium]
MQTLAPIALFTYNRIAHTKQTVQALQQNTLASQSDLYIFSDGWKDEADKNKVIEVRTYLHQITGFKSIQILESVNNKNLAHSLIKGISKLLSEYEKIIVFEDDIITSPLTLEFLNNALEIYKDDKNVGMIHSHSITAEGLPELFFDTRSGSWGWATWKRAWEEVNFNGEELLAEIQRKKLKKEFNYNSSIRFIKMLKHQIAGKNSSWAVRVYASFFLKGILTLYPGLSYSQHIGFDVGTHCHFNTKGDNIDGHIRAVTNVAKRIKITPNKEAQHILQHYLKARKRLTPRFIYAEIRKRIRKYFGI